MEDLHAQGKARQLGVSNVSVEQLEALHARAAVKPAFVQNRCYARFGWDSDVRAFCRAHGVAYQGFSLLTANVRELAQPAVTSIARRVGATVAQVVFRFAQQIAMIPLTGTATEAHMKEDLAAAGFDLRAEDLRAIERIAS
jgi:diketogulonate reductase-like aldo/keto reductase